MRNLILKYNIIFQDKLIGTITKLLREIQEEEYQLLMDLYDYLKDIISHN